MDEKQADPSGWKTERRMWREPRREPFGNPASPNPPELPDVETTSTRAETVTADLSLSPTSQTQSPWVCSHPAAGSIWELLKECPSCKVAGEPYHLRGHGYGCSLCGATWLLPTVVEQHNAGRWHLEGLKNLELREGLRREAAEARAEVAAARRERDRLVLEVQRIAKGLPPPEPHAPSGPKVKCEGCGETVSRTHRARHIARERARRRKKTGRGSPDGT